MAVIEFSHKKTDENRKNRPRHPVHGGVVRRRSSHERSYPTSGPVSTGMGDRLWAGIPSRYVTSQPGQLTLASPQLIRGR